MYFEAQSRKNTVFSKCSCVIGLALSADYDERFLCKKMNLEIDLTVLHSFPKLYGRYKMYRIIISIHLQVLVLCNICMHNLKRLARLQ